MCGIAGIIGSEHDYLASGADVHQMCQTIVHRGPDDEGIYAKGRAGLGMRRLSIIDLSTGHQPIHNEDGTVWVVFNGEIYNFPELRPALEARGHRFYTSTDTEVIVHLYEEFGSNCVQRLRGMFAFALWDERRERLLLARDPFGKKPLHYAIAKLFLLRLCDGPSYCFQGDPQVAPWTPARIQLRSNPHQPVLGPPILRNLFASIRGRMFGRTGVSPC